MKRNIIYHTIIFSFLIATASTLHAQMRATATASIEPAEIYIGEQALLTIKAFIPKSQHVIFPTFANNILINGIEVLAAFPNDTIEDEHILTVSKSYLLTSFDSTLYHIEHIPLLNGTDTIYTNSVGLKVSTMPLSSQTAQYLSEIQNTDTDSIDIQKLGVYDIKDIILTPSSWRDYIGVFFIIALSIISLVALYFIWKRVKHNIRKQKTPLAPQAIALPHMVALEALRNIKKRNLWEQGLEKEYVTEITLVLRKYLEEYYKIHAFEKTSREIIEILQKIPQAHPYNNILKDILQLADIVKFAKYTPTPLQNETIMEQACTYIEQTSTHPSSDTKEDFTQ